MAGIRTFPLYDMFARFFFLFSQNIKNVLRLPPHQLKVERLHSLFLLFE